METYLQKQVISFPNLRYPLNKEKDIFTILIKTVLSTDRPTDPQNFKKLMEDYLILCTCMLLRCYCYIVHTHVFISLQFFIVYVI